MKMFEKIGPMELVVILIVALLIFGPSKLPELGKSVGKGIREFKSAMKDITTTEDDKKEAKKDEQQDEKKA
jgi:sec-independent protein translocase protein TatA